ncbi:MAG: STAS/SEC14 domain-containing protein [Bacteroidetes bacterium]|nr:MAG: STAS/SEC14 domain-containing protein [Bacteroidota bacterium]
MEHKIWYDDQDNILVQEVIGFFSTEDALNVAKLYKEILEGKPYRHSIVDLSQAGKMENRETRGVINKILDEAGFSHVAFVGANSANRMIAKVLMKLGTLKAKSTFVRTREDAVKWLKDRRE